MVDVEDDVKSAIYFNFFVNSNQIIIIYPNKLLLAKFLSNPLIIKKNIDEKQQ